MKAAQDATCKGNSPFSSSGGLWLSWPITPSGWCWDHAQVLEATCVPGVNHSRALGHGCTVWVQYRYKTCLRWSPGDQVVSLPCVTQMLLCKATMKRHSITGTVQVLALPLAESFMFYCCSGGVSKNKPASVLFSVYFIWPSWLCNCSEGVDTTYL